MNTAKDDRVSEVLARLANVTDPELDEPVTDLGFVTDVTVNATGWVAVGFRLPTYWCAANFAFLMADDMHRAVAALPWVSGVRVTLGDHMYAETINRATETGLSFQEAFAEEADGDLGDVRRIFAMKAFQRRQMVLLDCLLATGCSVSAVLALTIGGLAALILGPGEHAARERYLELRPMPGPAGLTQAAFVDEAGCPVTVAGYDAHRRALRRVAVNVEFNGALCRGLLAARFNEVAPAGEPTLLDFVRGHVPERPVAQA